jgi:hypothetical protein
VILLALLVWGAALAGRAAPEPLLAPASPVHPSIQALLDRADREPADRALATRSAARVAAPNRPGPGAQTIHLRTDPLPAGMVIPGDPVKRAVTSFEIHGELPPDGDGQGSITLDESGLSFNEFGDATKVDVKTALPIPVVYRRIRLEKPMESPNSSRSRPPQLRLQPGEERRLYELVFADGSLPRQLQLVINGATGGPHRLLISRSPIPPQAGSRDTLATIMELHGRPVVQDPLGDAPLRSPLHLATLYWAPPGRLCRLTVRGIPDGPATLELDRNHLGFDVFGDVMRSTLVDYGSVKATLKRFETPDPAGKGRQLFEVMPIDRKLEERYFVVVSPTERGPHRLLIRQGEALRQLLALHDPERRYHLEMQPQLEQTARQERQAIADLRRAIGYRFRFHVEAGAVVGLSVYGGNSAERLDPMLKQLRHLRHLTFSGVPLGSSGLASLRHLTGLEQLSFSDAPIQDAGLASIRDLPQLQGLWFNRCPGITDQGVAHVRGLKNLKFLGLNREDYSELGEKRITDAGLEHLRRLTGLETLELHGQQITDAGLERLKNLSRLQQLSLSGEGITDAGLKHLEGLQQLRNLHLFQTRVTPAGIAALKARLPMLVRGDQEGF